jgi:hypothetical protein
LLLKISSAYNGYRTTAMKVLASSQHLLGGTASTVELAKLGSADVEDLFTPLTLSYFQDAYLNDVPLGVTSVGVVKSNGIQLPTWRGASPQ